MVEGCGQQCVLALTLLQGIAPFGEDICLLAFMLGKEEAEGAAANGGGAGTSALELVPHEAQRPEVLTAPQQINHARQLCSWQAVPHPWRGS